MARDLKFRIQKVQGLYYPCSVNKGADQLPGYREADLRLCFRICKNHVFSRRGSYMQGVQRKMVSVVNFLEFLKFKFICLVLAICDLVHDVEDILCHLP